MLEEYLGDGVYATFDGFQVWLDCRGQSTLSMTPAGRYGIALEPSTLKRLNEFVEHGKERYITAGGQQ